MDSHGGHDAHGHAHGAHDPAPSSHGGSPAEIPPPPAVRSLTPSVSDYELPWPGAGVLWPVLWLGIALLLYTAAGRGAHPIGAHGESHGEGAAEHEAPGH